MNGTCPECSRDLQPGAQTCACGWRAVPRTASGSRAARDPDWWRCAWTDRGVRCDNAGGISTSTYGGGPWYCRDHIHGVRAGSAHTQPTPPPMGFQALRSVIGRVPIVNDLERDDERDAIQAEEEVLP